MKHHSKLFFAALLSALCLAGPAMAAKPAVIDQTGLNGLQDYLDTNLPASMKATMAERGLAMWAITSAIRLQNKGYCVAVAGLTTASADGRMARRPAVTHDTIMRYDNVTKDWDSGDCRAESLREAIATLAKAPVPSVEAMRRLLGSGGTRDKQKADNGMINLSSQDVSDSTKAAAFDALHGYDLGAAVDYRHVTAVLYNGSFIMKKDGERVCFALFGLSARPPSDRAPRMPANNSTGLYAGDDEATCARGASLAAIRATLDQPWTKGGAFDGFDKTREDGVPLPDIAAVAKKRAAAVARAAAAEKRAATRVASTQRNVVRCSNSCTNGSCVRTFENGRKERWQAPRVYDAINNNWTWDITTNACGQ